MKPYIGYLLAIIFVLVIFYLLKSKNDVIKEKVQIEARLNDSLKVIKDQNKEFYHRIAGLEDLNKEKDDILKERDEYIISQTETIFRLNDIISHGVGSIDTVKVIDSSCIGLKLYYADRTPFYKLKINVLVDNPPIFDITQTFNPFKGTAHITRNEEGIYGGYLEISPDSIKPWIQISNFDVIIDRDEFLGKADIINLKFAPSISIGLNKDLKGLIAIGGQALIKETHLIGYERGINNDYNWIRYSYFPSFLSF